MGDSRVYSKFIPISRPFLAPQQVWEALDYPQHTHGGRCASMSFCAFSIAEDAKDDRDEREQDSIWYPAVN